MPFCLFSSQFFIRIGHINPATYFFLLWAFLKWQVVTGVEASKLYMANYTWVIILLITVPNVRAKHEKLGFKGVKS